MLCTIVGRTAVASTQSYATGAVALLTIVGVHRIASRLRFRPLLGKLADHRVRVLVPAMARSVEASCACAA